MSGTHERARLLALARAAAAATARRHRRAALAAARAARRRRTTAAPRGAARRAAIGGGRAGAARRARAAARVARCRTASKPRRHSAIRASARAAAAGRRLPAPQRPARASTCCARRNSSARFSLRGGTLAFEVVALAGDERFAVVTPHLRAQARGTVFTVEVDAQRTRRVYEGAVAVSAAAGGEHVLHAGQRDQRRRCADAGIRCSPRRARWPNSVAGLLQQRRRKKAPATAARTERTWRDRVSASGRCTRSADTPWSRRAPSWGHGWRARPRAACCNADGSCERPAGARRLAAARRRRPASRSSHLQAAHAAYAEAARASSGPERAVAGWKAAILAAARSTIRAPRCTRSTARRVDAPGSALRERGLLLRIEARGGGLAKRSKASRRDPRPNTDSAGAAELRARTGQ